MEWTVSEDNQWRQLGSIVNTVLLETRMKAMRNGSVSKPSPRPLAPRVANASGSQTGIGFLRKEAPALPSPVQLELPFGIGAAPQQALGPACAPRRARLM
jgi:hypothetical protein